jgi:PAS domain S-box-containing protein
MFYHNLEDFSHRFVLGESHDIASTSIYKRAMLTGYLSILVIGICGVYLAFDLLAGIYNAMMYYLTIVNFSVIAFFLNRSGRYEFAKFMLLFSTLGIIFLFSITEPIDSGNYFSFFPLTVAAFALFGYNQMYKGFLFFGFILLAFGIIYMVGVQWMPPDTQAAEISAANFILHFVVSIFATVLIILFLIKLNQNIESKLVKKDEHLLRTAQDLKESQQRFELAINGSNAGIYDWDIQKNTIYHSPTWKKLLGYDSDELDDFSIETFYDLIHPDDKNRAKTILESHLLNGSRYSVELRLQTKSGEYQWYSDAGQALWNENGDPIRMVGSVIMIHDRKLAEDRIKKQNRVLEKTNLELDSFVYSASHDIRSPLTSILGLINIAKASVENEEVEECLKLMTSRIHRLDDFLEDMLDFSRNMRLERKNREVNLYYFIDDIFRSYDFGDGFEKFEVKLNVPPDLEVMTDPMRLKIVLKNLISNSFKFSNARREKSWLRISSLKVNNNFQLIFEDNGVGIRPELQDKVFDMFYRASEQSKGSGLGLYIAREMVQKLDGSIKVKSIYGEGSQFIVELPDHTLKHTPDSVKSADNII